MDNNIWSMVFDDFCKTWYIDKVHCSVCGKKKNKTLLLINLRNNSNSLENMPKQRHCNICKDCLMSSTFDERVDIFAFLAVRRLITDKDCLICKRSVKRYIMVSKGSKDKCICYDCFVYGDKKRISNF